MIASSWVATSFVLSSVTASARVTCRANLGAPGLRAFLAVVRDQIVIPGNAVYGGCQWILIQPALMEAVG